MNAQLLLQNTPQKRSTFHPRERCLINWTYFTLLRSQYTKSHLHKKQGSAFADPCFLCRWVSRTRVTYYADSTFRVSIIVPEVWIYTTSQNQAHVHVDVYSTEISKDCRSRVHLHSLYLKRVYMCVRFRSLYEVDLLYLSILRKAESAKSGKCIVWRSVARAVTRVREMAFVSPDTRTLTILIGLLLIK